ncbi:MAG TPA: ABC transporter permease [Candidatus Kapabacteria bacterium]|nr:ABC transporter permease [Candidatus Kapabacteria bacterium]
MFQYILRRLLLFIPTLFIITVVTFGISRLAPGDPAELKAGVGGEGTMRGNQQLNEEMIKQIRAQWHLDKPIWYWSIFSDEKDANGKMLPLLSRLTFKWNGGDNQYILWVVDLLHLNFGKSFQDNRPVLDKVLERMPVTIFIGIVSIFLAYLISVPLGIYSATHENTTLDKASTVTLFVLYSLPDFWIGTMLIIFFGGGDFFAWFPNNGIHSMNSSPDDPFFTRTLDFLWHMVLPIAVETYASFAFISRQLRGSMLEVIRQDYIRTARAKGLSEKVVVYKHALRNSLIPIVTLLAFILPGIIGGSIIIETIFTIPGVGQLAFQALSARDYPVIMAEFTLASVLTLVGILLSDITYSLVDPRIAFSKKGG